MTGWTLEPSYPLSRTPKFQCLLREDGETPEWCEGERLMCAGGSWTPSIGQVLTVGYGDIYPVTTLGRVMAICIAYLGVGAVAIPTGIISAGFVEQYQRKSSLSSMKDADIQEIAEVFVDKRYAGKTIEEMEEEQNIKIFLVLRDDLSVLPQKNMVLKLNDIVIIRIENEA